MTLRTATRVALAGLAIALVIRFAAVAQTQPPVLRFEVASIRPSPPGPELDNPSFLAYRAGKVTSFCSICISGTHYDDYGTSLKVQVGKAFRIDARLVVGPDWLSQPEGTMFAIHAIMPAGATREQIPEMMKALLEERFHLVAHRAPVDQTGYALKVSKNGPKLKQSRDMDRSACEPWTESIPLPDGSPHLICQSTRDDGDRTVRIVMNSNTTAGPMLSASSRGDSLEVHTEYFRVTMPQLAEELANALSTGSPLAPMAGSVVQVVDRTGIDGAWDVVVDKTWGDLALSSVSASLEKQGLRVERTTAPTEKLIVDKLDKLPTENSVRVRRVRG